MQLSRAKSTFWGICLQALLLHARFTSAIQVNLDDDDSIKAAAKIVVDELMGFYTGNLPGQTPGLLPDPYYWWEAGAMNMVLLDYWFFTGDDTYNDIVTQAMLFQAGPNADFMPPNQTKTEGNDDQSFWGFAAITAAEINFPNPPADQPQWLALAQAVWNTQVARWDTATCGGGLRWQIFTFNNGYDYKNSISNGAFFTMSARLARYTGNQTYADWAEKIFDWMETSPFVTSDWRIYDGGHTTSNCTDVSKQEWSYLGGVFLLGAAHMFNHTGSDIWRSRTQTIMDATSVFFTNSTSGLTNVMFEAACEPVNLCNVDQRSFKAYLARWMAAATQLAPFTFDTIMPKLRNSATAAAAQCTGGTAGTTCGISWLTGTWDNSTGVGEQMTALEVIQSNLIHKVVAPVTAATGGTSQGDPSAGTQADGAGSPVSSQQLLTSLNIQTKDKVGAGFLTGLLALGVSVGTGWMIV